MLLDAPLFEDVADGPKGGAAHWIDTADGVRIRVGHWQPEGASGTVLLFPGRTEYIEKYGRAAADLAQRGYATLTIDWRGQGLAARLLSDRRTGHVHNFDDYQKDVAAMLAAAQELDLPRPYFLLAHSMGGCIGLRSVMDGLAVEACTFTGPMWGIKIAPATRPVAWALSWSSGLVGQGHRLTPGTTPETYVLSDPFEGNMLTKDPDMHAYMVRQLEAHGDLALGGPSLTWLHAALQETRALALRPAPNLPCLTFLGTDERIVDIPRIHQRMRSWPGGDLDIVTAGEHEVMMETPEIRAYVFDKTAQFFDAHKARAPRSKSA